MDGLISKWHYIRLRKKTWNKLQKIKGHEHSCGRPGVNGGYIANDKIKFGVNCFGYKPKITPHEAELMKNTPLYPKNKKKRRLKKKQIIGREKLEIC